MAAVQVFPGTATLTFLGATATFRATVTDQYGANYPGTVIWSSDTPAGDLVEVVAEVRQLVGPLALHLKGQEPAVDRPRIGPQRLAPQRLGPVSGFRRSPARYAAQSFINRRRRSNRSVRR